MLNHRIEQLALKLATEQAFHILDEYTYIYFDRLESNTLVSKGQYWNTSPDFTRQGYSKDIAEALEFLNALNLLTPHPTRPELVRMRVPV